MADEIRWGRVGDATTKQKALLARANDCCGGSNNRYRHPAWTEAMRAALGRRRATGGKWFSLIDRMYDSRLMGAAWERVNQSKSGAARQRGAGVDGETVEQFSQRNPAFTLAALRNLIFKAEPRYSSKGIVPGNGLLECGAVIRIGRKVLIDDHRFLIWATTQSRGARC